METDLRDRIAYDAAAAEVVAAVLAGDAPRLTALLDREPAAAAARDENGTSAVVLACRQAREDLAALLLARHPLLDIIDAAAAGIASRVSELVDRDPGAVRTLSADGFTPLHLAATFGHDAVARRLLRRGADVLAIARNDSHAQPLHCAAAGGHALVALALLKAGAIVDARQTGGRTALHLAAHAGDIDTIDVLLRFDAKSKADDAGLLPADVARAAQHEDAARRLA